MLQQIQFHIHEDEVRQQEIERSLAATISENYRLSVGALERFIPSLADLITKHEASVSTLLCNKHSELNIVNYNSGQVLYGMHPQSEVLAHFSEYMKHASQLIAPPNKEAFIDALVCLGLGLGYHLAEVVRSGDFKHIIVYEPNIDYFICSLSSLDWRALLQEAKNKGIALYLQVGSDGSNVFKDLQELYSHLGVDRFTFFKHLNTTPFNKIEEKLKTSSWDELSNWQPRRTGESLSESDLPVWAPLKSQFDFNDKYLNRDLKKRNLEVLKEYFPELYTEFHEYQPSYWSPTANVAGEVNVYHISTQGLFSESSLNDAQVSYEEFHRKPNKDGLLLSYTGKKLKGFLHYQLVEACEKVIKDLEEVQSELPHRVKSFIMFGLGNGYSVEQLISQHDIEMMFVCEPNKDFFYASLYAVDWQTIIEAFDDGKKRLYLNIGDDGTNLTNDLLAQFQTVGPYVLANTFFYQSYVNDKLTEAVSRLREQLLVIIAMGDYFDNAKYGIAHTLWALENDVPFLMSGCKQKLSKDVLDVPVFIIGNGPSLDGLIDILKAEQHQALLISCGTALQSLHRHGIKPDFHAEIETNRSTFDWLSRIGDDNYLKEITLLSCNGMHPDSAALFGNTLLAFKQGEASTVSITEIDKSHPFALLNYAYPTVTNFVSDLITEIGFSQIYLFGTDMGFVSDTYHHSKSSGYYDGSGNELYSYANNHAMSLVIPGNFKPWVKTKYEFKISKGVLEQVFSQSDAEIYNLNDGAKILGTKALQKDLVLLSSSLDAKLNARKILTEQAFKNSFNEKYLSLHKNRYNTKSLLEELEVLETLLDSPLVSLEDVEALVSKQRDFIVSSYLRKKSLSFYYLNGTFNYINSMFSKLLNISEEKIVVEAGNSLLSLWRAFVSDVVRMIRNDQYGPDNISPFVGLRRNKFLADNTKVPRVRVEHEYIDKPIITKSTELLLGNNDEVRHVTLSWLGENNTEVQPHQDTCYIARDVKKSYFSNPIRGLLLIGKGDFREPSHPYQSNPIVLTNTALNALLSGFKNAIFLQKVSQHPLMDPCFFDDIVQWSASFICYSGPDYLVLVNEYISDKNRVLPTGDRLMYLPRLKAEDFRYEVISDSENNRRIQRVYEAYEEFNNGCPL